MEQKIVSGEKFQKVNNKYLITLIIVFLVLSILITYTLIKFNSQKVYDDITVGSFNLNGMSKSEAIQNLSKFYEEALDQTIIIKVKDNQKEVSFKEMEVTYNINKAIDNAYSLGKNKGALGNFLDIIDISINGRKVDIGINYNKDKLEQIIKELEKDILINPIDDSYRINNNLLTFKFGSSGEGLDRKDAILKVEKLFKSGNGGILELKKTSFEPKKLDVNSISPKPVDATYIVSNKRTITYIPEKSGILFDKKRFLELMESNSFKKQSFSIPIQLVMPSVSKENLKNNMFSDTLGICETNFSWSDQSRKENIKLATSKIGEIILAPGDEFSYNEVVGPRTADQGFKKAHVYSNGQVIDDFGGGICQTSSTLYNAVIKANLQITERQNHMFTVGYAPVGLDATVSYGTIDFKFKNNKSWPVKVIGTINGNNVQFKILGTNINKNESVEYLTKIIKKVPFDIQRIEDSNMVLGTFIVDQEGKNGYVVEVYKIVKQNNQVLSETFLYKDTYRPLKKIMRIGTKLATSSVNAEGNNINVEETQIEKTLPVIEEDSGIILQ